MKIEVSPNTVEIETDNYKWEPITGTWRFVISGARVTNSHFIAALNKWRASEEMWEAANPSLNDPPKPKRKWEIAFTDRAYVQVEAHSFILSSDDIAFHVDGQVLPVFWAQTRNIYHVKELA